MAKDEGKEIYVSGFDGYKQDVTGEDTLGTMYVINRRKKRFSLKRIIFNWLKPLIVEEIKRELSRRDELFQKLWKAKDLEAFLKEHFVEK